MNGERRSVGLRMTSVDVSVVAAWWAMGLEDTEKPHTAMDALVT